MSELAILCLETNAAGKVRREKYDGRDFLVVPVIAQVAGVVNGELATAEELGKFPGAWEGIPIVVGDHPVKKGIAVSARTKDQLHKSPGWLFNTKMDKKGKLKGEIWLDINKANALGGDAKRAVETLESGGKTEVSTAYFRDVEEKSGSFKGKKYKSVAHNLRPDHLAILFDQPGACNWKEGCGAPRTNQEQSMEAERRAIADAWHAHQRKRTATLLPEERMDFWIVETFGDHIIVRAGAEFFKVAYEQLEDGTFSFADKGKWEKVKEKKEWIAVNILSKARRSSFSGTETTSWGSVNKSFNAYRDGYFKHVGAHPPDDPVASVANAPQAMKTWIASKSLLGDAQAATFDDLLFFPVVNPSTNNLNRGALIAVTGGRGAQAKIPAAAKTSAQNMARSLLKSQYKVKSNSALVILSALQAIGLDQLVPVQGEKQEDPMDRKQMIQTLLACNHCEFTQEQLEAMEDGSLEHLTGMAQQIATLTANAAQDGGDDAPPPETPPEADPSTPAPETNAAPPAVPPELQALADMAKRLGGVERLEAMITSNASQEAQERGEIVGRLVGNTLCAFSEDELKALSMANLRKLDTSLAPASYGGRFMPPTSNVGQKPKGAPTMPAVLLAQPANSQN